MRSKCFRVGFCLNFWRENVINVVFLIFWTSLLNFFFLGKKPKIMNDESLRLCFSPRFCRVVIENLFKRNQGNELQDWDLTAIWNFFPMSSKQELKLKKIVYWIIETLYCLQHYAFLQSVIFLIEFLGKKLESIYF